MTRTSPGGSLGGRATRRTPLVPETPSTGFLANGRDAGPNSRPKGGSASRRLGSRPSRPACLRRPPYRFPSSDLFARQRVGGRTNTVPVGSSCFTHAEGVGRNWTEQRQVSFIDGMASNLISTWIVAAFLTFVAAIGGYANLAQPPPSPSSQSSGSHSQQLRYYVVDSSQFAAGGTDGKRRTRDSRPSDVGIDGAAIHRLLRASRAVPLGLPVVGRMVRRRGCHRSCRTWHVP